ncbi:hypothetical protein Syun_010688 [Stephania yunnanensis]|uniref:Uncharacterized protein n=1 Tax=Stephania yunnanensis TaxID=152371 RepID=A0AAP0PRX0_9MAGN
MEELLLPVNVPKRKKSTCSHFQCNTLKRKDREQDRASSQQNGIASSPNASDSVSVTGILTRYFPDFDEVKSYPGSSSNKTIDLLENESHQADQDGNVKSNAAENSSVALDQRELPISANDALAEIPCSISPTNTCTRVARAKHGKFKTWKPMPSKTALPDSPKPKTAKGSKLQRSKVRKLLPPKVPSTDKPSPSTLRNRIETSCEVGKRLIQAANDLGILTSKRKPTVSSCKSKGVKFSSTLVRKLEFDFE